MYYVSCIMYYVYERYVCVLCMRVARCGWLANSAALCLISQSFAIFHRHSGLKDKQNKIFKREEINVMKSPYCNLIVCQSVWISFMNLLWYWQTISKWECKSESAFCIIYSKWRLEPHPTKSPHFVKSTFFLMINNQQNHAYFLSEPLGKE